MSAEDFNYVNGVSIKERIRKILLEHLPSVPENQKDAAAFADSPTVQKETKHCRRKRNRRADVKEQKLVQKIASACSFDELMAYLSHKSSTQALDLMLEAIKLDTENMKGWVFRRDLLEEHKFDLYKELDSMRLLAKTDIKFNNRNTWNHILWVVEQLGSEAANQEFVLRKEMLANDPEDYLVWEGLDELADMLGTEVMRNELKLTSKIIDIDAKNAHAWSYRQLLIEKLRIGDREPESDFVRSILHADPENGYAWSYNQNLYLLLLHDADVSDNESVWTEEKLRAAHKLRSDVENDELDFIEKILVKDAKNIRAWSYRWWLVGCNPHIEKELGLTEKILSLDAKNYLAWCHRRCVFDILISNPTRTELSVTRGILSKDTKNIYAWYYRQWVLGKLGEWEAELKFCDEILTYDITNEFALNQRIFVLRSCGRKMGDTIRNVEVIYPIRAIVKEPQNECPWRCLRTLYLPSNFNDGCLEAILKFVLSDRISNVEDIGMDIMMNGGIYVNALDTVLELICFGYQPSLKIGVVIADLCSRLKLVGNLIDDDLCLKADDKSIHGFLRGISSILQYVDPMNRLYWKWLTESILDKVDMVYDLSEEFNQVL